MDEFEKKVRFLLNNRDIAKRVGKEGYDHMMKYHTSQARVQYIIDILEKKNER